MKPICLKFTSILFLFFLTAGSAAAQLPPLSLGTTLSYWGPIEVQDPPDAPTDTGKHPDHNADSDSQSGGGSTGGGAGTPVTYNCKEETCRIRNEFDGRLYRCTCCKPNGSGQNACTQCNTFTCSGGPIG